MTLKRRDGQPLIASINSHFYRDKDGNIIGIEGVFSDITDRRKAEETLRWKSTFLEALVDSSNDGILVLDARSHKIMENQRFRDVFKMNPEADEEEHILRLVRAIEDPQEFRQKLAHICSQPKETISFELALKDGSTLDACSYPVLAADGQQHYGRIWTFRDITELRRYWDMIESLSITDGLTNLSNRRRFDEYLETEWRRCMRADSALSLILMDIDFFKQFNDHYGHLAGDDCLRQIGNVLQKTVLRSGDLPARYGGEEFGCVLPGTGLQSAVALARTIMRRVDQLNVPHLHSSVDNHVTLSIGVASCRPESGRDAAFLIGLADELLYSAKQAGRHRIKWQENEGIVGAGE